MRNKNITPSRFLLIAALLLLIVPSKLCAQINVSLQQPPPNQLKVADLWRVTLINTSRQTYTVYLQGTAKEASAGPIVDAQTATFTLPPGTKIVTGQNVSPIKVNSSNGRYKNVLLQTGTVPAGNYTICVTVRAVGNGEELGNDCIEQKVENASMVLINPSDESTVEEDLPIFIWTSTPPLGTGATYSLKIVELLGNQSAIAAMQSNSAVHTQTDIHTTTLQYPISASKLIPGRNYAWAVTAFENGAALSTSEVWKFTYKVGDTAVPYKLKKKKEILAQFERLYGGSSYDHGWAIALTKDTGYIIAGYTRSFGTGNDDGLLIKVDKSGGLDWARTYGGENDDGFYAVTQVNDGGYVAVGFTRSFDVGNDDIYVVKVSKDGEPEYSRVLGGGGFDAGYGVTASPEDGVVIVGAVGRGDDYDAYVTMLDKGGNSQWAENFGLFECDVAHAVARTVNSGYVIAGYTRSGGQGNDDMLIMTVGREGTLKSMSTYGSYLADRAEAITSIGEAGFVVAGYRPNDQMTDAGDVSLVTLGPSGEKIVFRQYNAGSIDKGIALTSTSDRGIVAVGYNSGDTVHPGGVIAFKTNQDGAVEWSRFYRDSKLAEGYGVVQASDGGFAITGYSDAGPEGDAFLIKTDAKGVLGCDDKDGGVTQLQARGNYEPFAALGDRGIVNRSVSSQTGKPPIKVELICPKPTGVAPPK
jgi:hypothetical protein